MNIEIIFQNFIRVKLDTQQKTKIFKHNNININKKDFQILKEFS